MLQQVGGFGEDGVAVGADQPSRARIHRLRPFGGATQHQNRLAQGRSLLLLLPLHRNPTVREPLQALLGDHPRAFLTEPLDYDRLVAAMRGCTLLLTDSGGLQEEAPALGKPVLVLRRTTERPEAVDAGTARLIGTDSETILAETANLLEHEGAYEAMARAHNPFGDGYASERILATVRRFLATSPAP